MGVLGDEDEGDAVKTLDQDGADQRRLGVIEGRGEFLGDLLLPKGLGIAPKDAQRNRAAVHAAEERLAPGRGVDVHGEQRVARLHAVRAQRQSVVGTRPPTQRREGEVGGVVLVGQPEHLLEGAERAHRLVDLRLRPVEHGSSGTGRSGLGFGTLRMVVIRGDG